MSDRGIKAGISWTALMSRLRSFGYFILRDRATASELTGEEIATWSECGSIDGPALASALEENTYTSSSVPGSTIGTTGFISNEQRLYARTLSRGAVDALINAARVAIGDSHRTKPVELTKLEFALMDKGLLDSAGLPTPAGWFTLLTIKHVQSPPLKPRFRWFKKTSPAQPVDQIDALCAPLRAHEIGYCGGKNDHDAHEARI